MSKLRLAVLGLLLCTGCGQGPEGDPDRRISSPIQALAETGDQEGFELALEPRDFTFPRDHGPHPGFQTEWWYITANLDSPSGRRFGVQWTIFRRALSAHTPERSSTWAGRQLYMGHMAVSDIDGGRQLAAERFSRDAPDLAGAQADPFHVWLEDWSAESESAGSLWPLNVRSAAQTTNGEFRVELRLEAGKPMVLQGDRGLSQKHEGGASYYYSFTRLAARGEIVLDGETFQIQGNAWLDREWSTNTLGSSQAGWDWFSLQLSDGRDLMFYQLRQKDGSAHAMSAGVLVAEDGSKTNPGIGRGRALGARALAKPENGRVLPRPLAAPGPGPRPGSKGGAPARRPRAGHPIQLLGRRGGDRGKVRGFYDRRAWLCGNGGLYGRLDLAPIERFCLICRGHRSRLLLTSLCADGYPLRLFCRPRPTTLEITPHGTQPMRPAPHSP